MSSKLLPLVTYSVNNLIRMQISKAVDDLAGERPDGIFFEFPVSSENAANGTTRDVFEEADKCTA